MTSSHGKALSLAIAALLAVGATTAQARVPVRISIKFILDADGNRPATGRLNTDAEIDAEVTEGMDILRDLYSELTLAEIEFVELTGLSQWFSTSVGGDPGPDNRDALRNAAIAAPATYHWRTDAINIYINGGPSSAISDFPPNNNMILMNQGCTNTPSCVLHELGHSLNLMHTHETCCTNGDECADTLADNQDWSRDQIAQNNYGCLYANCGAGQRAAVDLVFNNVMSYHVSERQDRLSPCQMSRISGQASSDQAWMLSKRPVYVDSGASILFPQLGLYPFPFRTLQGALDAGGLTDKVLVLEQGTYSTAGTSARVEMVTRSGPSTVVAPGAQSYVLPVDLSNSRHPEVRRRAREVQEEDKLGRKAAKDAETAAAKAARDEEKAALRAQGRAAKKQHEDSAVAGLLAAGDVAEGDERLAIQLELAQRYRDAGECGKAVEFFGKVADATDQPNLRQEALWQIERCRKASAGEAQ